MPQIDVYPRNPTQEYPKSGTQLIEHPVFFPLSHN